MRRSSVGCKGFLATKGLQGFGLASQNTLSWACLAALFVMIVWVGGGGVVGGRQTASTFEK